MSPDFSSTGPDVLRTLCLPLSSDFQVTVVPGLTVMSWGESFDPMVTVLALAAAARAVGAFGAWAANAVLPLTARTPATSTRHASAAKRESPVVTCWRMVRSLFDTRGSGRGVRRYGARSDTVGLPHGDGAARASYAEHLGDQQHPDRP